MNDIAKELAINCKTQRERDQYVIDHATYFQCVYKTQKSHISSEKFKTEADARSAAEFSSKIIRMHSKRFAGIKVIATLQDDKGRAITATVEEITEHVVGAN